VVLAMRIEADVLDQHKIVVARGLAEGAVEHLDRAFAIALVKLLIGIDDALGRLQHALARRIVAGIGNEGAHRLLGLLARGPRRHRLRRRPNVVGQALLRPRRDIGGGVLGIHDEVSVRPASAAGWPRQLTRGVLDGAFPFYTVPRALRTAGSTPIYSFAQATQSSAAYSPNNPMLNDVYNAKILELAGNIPRLGRLAAPDASATAHSKLCG